MKTQIRTGLASFGMSGLVFHAPLLAAHVGFEITAILERTKSASAALYPSAKIVRSFEELLENPDIELVIVNTPDHLHFGMAKQALEAGKHVVVEKPFTISIAEGGELIRLAKSKNLILSVFQNRRWDGDFLTVSKILQNGWLGRLVEFESHFDRYRNFIQQSWKEAEDVGTGVLYNLGSHMIDQALVLFGMPKKLIADLRTTRTGGNVTDNYTLMLYYEQLRVILKSGYLVREAGPRYQLHGTEGSFVKYGIDPQEDTLKAGGKPNAAGWGSEPFSDWGTLHTTHQGLTIKGKIETIHGNYLAYYDSIWASIREGKPLIVEPEQALQVIKIIELAQKSHEKGEAIIVS